jgi:hypothetical protein
MGNKGSIPFHSTKINNMTITVKVNNENICVSDFYLMLMEKQISNVEFEKLVFERTGKKLIRQFS